MNDKNLFPYLLIDNGLLQDIAAGYIEADSKSRPNWLMPIYNEPALNVSPLLIDLDSAYEAGKLDEFMGYLNALNPALHASIIETAMSLEQLAQHLRRFIFILDAEGKQFTLRYADCSVLAALSSVFTARQWATLTKQITRWGIHDRSGKLIQLLQDRINENVPTPLCLGLDQLSALDEVSEADHYIAQVQMMHHGKALPGSSEEQYKWAQAARQAWKASNNLQQRFLLSLTEAALITKGEVLRRQEIQHYLLMDNITSFTEKIRNLTSEIQLRQSLFTT